MREDRKSDPQVATFTPGDVSGVTVRAFRSSERALCRRGGSQLLGDCS